MCAFKIFHLFVWFLAVLGLGCRASFPLVAVWGLLGGAAPLAAQRWLRSPQACRAAARGLQSTGSGVTAYGLSCPAACEVLDRGLNLCLLRGRAGSLPLSHQGGLNVF